MLFINSNPLLSHVYTLDLMFIHVSVCVRTLKVPWLQIMCLIGSGCYRLRVTLVYFCNTHTRACAGEHTHTQQVLNFVLCCIELESVYIVCLCSLLRMHGDNTHTHFDASHLQDYRSILILQHLLRWGFISTVKVNISVCLSENTTLCSDCSRAGGSRGRDLGHSIGESNCVLTYLFLCSQIWWGSSSVCTWATATLPRQLPANTVVTPPPPKHTPTSHLHSGEPSGPTKHTQLPKYYQKHWPIFAT